MDSSVFIGAVLLVLCCGCWSLMYWKISSVRRRWLSPFKVRQLLEEYEFLVDLGRTSGLILNVWVLTIAGLVVLTVWTLLP